MMANGAKSSYSALITSVADDVAVLRQELELRRKRYARCRSEYDKARAEAMKRRDSSLSYSFDIAQATYRRNLAAWRVRERERFLRFLVIFADAVAAGQMPITDAIACAEREAKRSRERRPKAPDPEDSYGGYEKDMGEWVRP